MNVLFVCTGNTCRSPMAEGYFKLLCEQAGADNFVVSSAGTCTYDGAAVSENSVKAVSPFGVNISGHKSSSLDHQRINDADCIIAMGMSHKLQLSQYYPESLGKMALILEFVGENGDLADPFGGSQEVYNKCFEQMKPALDNLFLDLNTKE